MLCNGVERESRESSIETLYRSVTRFYTKVETRYVDIRDQVIEQVFLMKFPALV